MEIPSHIKENFRITLIYCGAIGILSYLLFGNLIFQLNAIQLDWSGDGFKNYFSFAYQYRYGNGLWFEGMQYPYGDLISYADGQPALVLIFQILRWIGIDISGYELGIVQYLPVISLLPACLLLHNIAKNYKIPNTWAYFTVLACIGLSPQLYRFNAHFALAYTFCIPAFWYLLLKYESNKISGVKLLFISVPLGLFFAFIHPYNLLIVSIFILAYFLLKSISKRKLDLSLLAISILPIFLYLTINHFTDPYLDRPQNPYGIWEYKTEVSDLLPFYGWFPKLFSFLPGLRNHYNEGYAYIGISGIISIVLISLGIKNHIRNFKFNRLNIFVLASLLCLLFAMGVHLLITDKKILELLPPLRQFRALGRFAWPFYYVAFITSSVYLHRWSSHKFSRNVHILFLSVISVFWCLDIYAYTKSFHKSYQAYLSNNILVENTEIQKIIGSSNYKTQDFQAVLPLPVPVEGAEKYSTLDDWFVKLQCMPYVFQTQTPMVGCYMSRTSLSRILKQSQLGSSSYVKKTVFDDLKDDRDFLLLVAKVDTLLYDDLITHSTYLGETNEVVAYASTVKNLSKSLPLIPSDSSKLYEPLYYNNFLEESENGLLSKGSKKINDNFEICTLVLDTIHTDSLVFSIWHRIDSDLSTTPLFNINFYNSSNELIDKLSYRDRNIRRFEIINNWVQIKNIVPIPAHAKSIAWNISAENLFIDHALVSDYGKEISLSLGDGYLIRNHYIGQNF